MTHRNDTLAVEARALLGYLGADPPAATLVERYVAANHALFDDDPPMSDETIIRFAVAHRWALPLLDGATSVVLVRSRFRQKLFLAAALLEASTSHVDVFVPGYTSPPVLFVKLSFWSLKAVGKAFLGIPLLAVLYWRSR